MRKHPKVSNRAASEFGRMGGKARVAKLTPEERSASARKAVQARWAKARAAVAK